MMRGSLERLGIWLLNRLGYVLFLHHAGCVIIPRWRQRDRKATSVVLKDLAMAQELTDLFATLNVDCVLDVGANRGQFGRFLRDDVGYRGLILSFEPVARIFADLSSVAANDPKWDVFPIALGRENADREINAMEGPEFSSFRKPATSISDPLFRQYNAVRYTESVKLRRLADVMPELQSKYHFQHPYLKLDTQGFDLEVIAGSGDALDQFVALQAEMSVEPLYEGSPSYRTSLEVLEDLGFRISGTFWVARSHHRMLEFDCVLVREDSVRIDT
jgi:FkbM family methyltransferase